jgi:hypothetical protein
LEGTCRNGSYQCLWSWPTTVSFSYACLGGSNLLIISSNRTQDILMNPELLIPPRPTISNIQWISGTQHVTPADMDLLSKSTTGTLSASLTLLLLLYGGTSLMLPDSRRPRSPAVETHARPSPLRSRASSSHCSHEPQCSLLIQLYISIISRQSSTRKRRLGRLGIAPIE